MCCVWLCGSANRSGGRGIVLDPQRGLVGLLWGGRKKSGQGHFTLIRLVINDIELFTGKKAETY